MWAAHMTRRFEVGDRQCARAGQATGSRPALYSLKRLDCTLPFQIFMAMGILEAHREQLMSISASDRILKVGVRADPPCMCDYRHLCTPSFIFPCLS
jgi:hypothetical protein